MQKFDGLSQKQDGLSYIALDLNQRNFETKRMDFDSKFNLSTRPTSYLSGSKYGFNQQMSKLDDLLNSFNRKSVK